MSTPICVSRPVAESAFGALTCAMSGDGTPNPMLMALDRSSAVRVATALAAMCALVIENYADLTDEDPFEYLQRWSASAFASEVDA
jgi:hypothetical protein